MTPEDIDPCLCTHVIYAFSEMDNNQLTPMEKHDLKDGSQPGKSLFLRRVLRFSFVLLKDLKLEEKFTNRYFI